MALHEVLIPARHSELVEDLRERPLDLRGGLRRNHAGQPGAVLRGPARRRKTPPHVPDRQRRNGAGLARPRRDAASRRCDQGVLLPSDKSAGERDNLCQRTIRAARAAGRLDHPNVVAVHDVVRAEGRPWIVMELVRSRSLYQVVRDNGPLSPRRAAEIWSRCTLGAACGPPSGRLARRPQAGQ
jgi:serine/threonine protein kinase